MKKKLLTLSFCLASLGLAGCVNKPATITSESSSETPSSSSESSSSNSSSSCESSVERQETTVDTIFEALTYLKNATSYKSSFSKEGFTTKTLVYAPSYIYSSKSGSGHILLSGFKADQDKASFSFTLSGNTVSVSFADMDGKNYLSNLDSFVKTKRLNVTKDMLSLNSEGKRVLLKDPASCELLLDLIGGQNEDNPYEISEIEIYFNRYNELILSFYEGDAKVDEAAVSNINSASEKAIETYLANDGVSLLTGGSLTKEKMTYVVSEDLQVSSKIQKTITSIVSDDGGAYLRKSANKLYRNKTDNAGEITDEEAYVLDEDECFTEYYLSVDNTVKEHYNEDDYWTDVFDISSVEPELFKKSSGNNYDYYGGKAETILSNLINEDEGKYGNVSSLYAVVKDNQVKSFTFTLDSGYIITSTFVNPTGEVPTISPKKRVEGVGDRLETAFNKLAYSLTTNGFAISMNTRGHGSEYNTIEGIYTKDVVMNYNRSITNSDTMRYEGIGYQVRDGKLFAFNVGGSDSGDETDLEQTYSFSGREVTDGNLSSKWFNIVASPDVFYKKAGTENTFVMHKGLLNYGNAFPISLYDGEEITDVSVVLDSSDNVSEIHLEVAYNGEDEGESVMKFTYGSETSPILSTDAYTKLDQAYAKLIEPMDDFTGIKNVKNNLVTNAEKPVSEEILKDLPYINVEGASSLWNGSFDYDTSTWQIDYSKFTITLSAITLSDFNIDAYYAKYITLLNKKGSYTKSGEESLDTYGVTTTSETFTNSTLKYSLVVVSTNDPDYGDISFSIKVTLL